MSRLLDLQNFVAEKLAWHQSIASDPTISLSAKAVAGFILHDLNVSQGGAWRGQASMAAGLGVSERQLRRLLDELEAASYLQVEVRKGRGRTNIYRATVPDHQVDTPQKRTSTTDQATENRTQVATETQKKRTSATRKPDIGVRQFLYDPIRRFPPLESRRPSGGEGTLARVGPFAQSDIREAVIRIAGEGATVSYLDPAAWDADSNRIVCTSSTGFARLLDLVGRPLAAKGVSIALQPRDAGRMAA